MKRRAIQRQLCVVDGEEGENDAAMLMGMVAASQ
jgi:hypothetical protein